MSRTWICAKLDSYAQHAGAKRLRSAVERTIRTERVSFVDLAQNPWLAARARAELDPLGFASPGHNGDAQVSEYDAWAVMQTRSDSCWASR